ncbi:hypothetical protein [Nocardiopsis ganjiahuensis]|uniref:hypothetical protein n=1 Tax=Nocardiopsis ganjiahuensis TaxID=239984 RepID=UPI000344EC57|nr:hypothetical protein [Nocardiopsis ganjiahuensis]
MALPNESRRAPAGRGRRPQDAPPLHAVPTTDNAPEPGVAGLPEAVARAVKAAPPAPERDQEPVKAAPPPAPVAEEADPSAPPAGPQAPVPAGEDLAVAQDGRTAADVARSLTWLGVTYRPPDIWRQRQPSLREEFDFVMAGAHLPEQGPWRLLARLYAAPAMALIGVLHALIWILRSPARHATAWALGLLVVVSAAFML